MTNPLFYAKILLFGEYGIIEDSQGLTLPYSFYKGTLKFNGKIFTSKKIGISYINKNTLKRHGYQGDIS